MTSRSHRWREKLMGNSKWAKRTLYYEYIQGRDDITPSLLKTIQVDLPRTYPQIPWVKQHSARIEALLVAYAAVHRGDSYLQGFNYLMTILLYTFQETTHADADTWWCFSRIVGLVRPMMPDFNVSWFHWMRRHWLDDLR